MVAFGEFFPFFLHEGEFSFKEAICGILLDRFRLGSAKFGIRSTTCGRFGFTCPFFPASA